MPRFISIFSSSFIMVSIFATGNILGQSRVPLTLSTADGTITRPLGTGVLGNKDVTALTEMANYAAVVGVSPWTGMLGTGTIIYGSHDPTAYSATLSNFGSSQFRLDAQSGKGSLSIRISNVDGRIQEADGTPSFFAI